MANQIYIPPLKGELSKGLIKSFSESKIKTLTKEEEEEILSRLEILINNQRR